MNMLPIKHRHTSVVVFGKEVFYGQGISITAPGQSHVSIILSLVSLVALNKEDSMEHRCKLWTWERLH